MMCAYVLNLDVYVCATKDFAGHMLQLQMKENKNSDAKEVRFAITSL